MHVDSINLRLMLLVKAWVITEICSNRAIGFREYQRVVHQRQYNILRRLFERKHILIFENAYSNYHERFTSDGPGRLIEGCLRELVVWPNTDRLKKHWPDAAGRKPFGGICCLAK